MSQLEVLVGALFYLLLIFAYALFGLDIETCFNLGMSGVAYVVLRPIFQRKRN